MRSYKAGFRGIVFGALLAGMPSLAWSATISVVPVSPYVLDATKVVAYAGRSDGSAPISPAGSGMATNYTFYDLRKGVAGGSSPESQMLLFDLSVSGLTPGANEVITVIAGAGDSPTTSIVPFGGASLDTSSSSAPGLCSTTNTLCSYQDDVTLGAATPLFHGVRITSGSKVRVGIYARDICAKNAGGLSTLCTGNLVAGPNDSAAPTSWATKSIKLTFYALVSNTSVTARPTPDSNTANDYVTAQFYAVALDINASDGNSTAGNLCTGLAFTSPPYFPGDGEISVIGSRFKIIPVSGSTLTQASAILVVAGEALALPTTSNYTTAPIYQTVGASGESAVGGFQNSDPSGTPTHNYTLYFSYMDRSGMLGPFSCFTDNSVKTAQIFGFLKKNACFVATGAFRAEPSAGVALLQKFRDEVLNRSPLGREIRNWYYAWSPAAGLWLLEHPEFRLPVLRALLPLEAMAWVLLHPLLAGALGLLSIFVIAGAVYARAREGGEAT